MLCLCACVCVCTLTSMHACMCVRVYACACMHVWACTAVSKWCKTVFWEAIKVLSKVIRIFSDQTLVCQASPVNQCHHSLQVSLSMTASSLNSLELIQSKAYSCHSFITWKPKNSIPTATYLSEQKYFLFWRQCPGTANKQPASEKIRKNKFKAVKGLENSDNESMQNLVSFVCLLVYQWYILCTLQCCVKQDAVPYKYFNICPRAVGRCFTSVRGVGRPHPPRVSCCLAGWLGKVKG